MSYKNEINDDYNNNDNNNYNKTSIDLKDDFYYDNEKAKFNKIEKKQRNANKRYYCIFVVSLIIITCLVIWKMIIYHEFKSNLKKLEMNIIDAKNRLKDVKNSNNIIHTKFERHHVSKYLFKILSTFLIW